MSAEIEYLMQCNYPELSQPAIDAMVEMLCDRRCVPSPEVVTELGKIGLAYRPNLRLRSRRIVLTDEGAKLLGGKDNTARTRLEI